MPYSFIYPNRVSDYHGLKQQIREPYQEEYYSIERFPKYSVRLNDFNILV
jgi:hypothetical protein